jgi:hypothetical protein
MIRVLISDCCCWVPPVSLFIGLLQAKTGKYRRGVKEERGFGI